MSESKKLLVSPSPHIHSGDTIERNMYDVLLALLPALVVSVLFFGWNALIISITSMVACVLFEWLIARFLMQKKELTITDGSAALTGLLLALNLPSTLPLWIVIVGAFMAIGIGKMSYGGLGNNIFNPAILGRVMLLISFPQQMTNYPAPSLILESGTADAVTGATPLAIIKGVAKGTEGVSVEQLPSAIEMLLGQHPGSFGEISAVALLLGFAYLLLRKVVTWHIPVVVLSSVFLFASIMHLANPEQYIAPFYHLISGGMILGACFMATDYVTSPMSKGGMILFGIMIGVITMVIRLFGSYPEGMSFAILIMNAFTPMINRFMPPTLFGAKASK